MCVYARADQIRSNAAVYANSLLIVRSRHAREIFLRIEQGYFRSNVELFKLKKIIKLKKIAFVKTT
jgi:hypothetical protein